MLHYLNNKRRSIRDSIPISTFFFRFSYAALTFSVKKVPPLTCTLHQVIISFSLFCFYYVDISLRAPPICKIDCPRRPCTCLFQLPLIYVRENGLDRRFVFPLQLSDSFRFFFQKRRALTRGLGYSLLPGVNCDNASRLRRKFLRLGCHCENA